MGSVRGPDTRGVPISHSRRWLLAGLVLAAASASIGVAAVRSVAATRQDDFNRARASTDRVIVAAIEAKSRRWAPDALAEAEEARRAGLRAAQVELASLWPLPDFSVANGHLATATTAARQAALAARQLEAEARTEARDAIEVVRGAIGTQAVHARVLGAEATRAASRARLAYNQAVLSYAEGDYELALTRATEARGLTEDVRARIDAIGSRYADEGQLANWRRLADATIAWSRRTGHPAIVVSKADHRLTLYVDGRAVRRYDVDLSGNWVADKLHAGDGAVPEGEYHVAAKKGRGQSRYHKALLLDYPNDADRRAFAARKREGALPGSARIGGLIEIHGSGGQQRDWTNGCVALLNPEMDYLFSRVQVGTPVTIIGATTARTAGDLQLVIGEGGD